MFHGCIIHLAPLGSITRLRRDIIAQNIKSLGGKISPNVEDATHVIVSDASITLFSKDCPVRRSIIAHLHKVVDEEWYEASIRLKSRVDEAGYRVTKARCSRSGVTLLSTHGDRSGVTTHGGPSPSLKRVVTTLNIFSSSNPPLEGGLKKKRRVINETPTPKSPVPPRPGTTCMRADEVIDIEDSDSPPLLPCSVGGDGGGGAAAGAVGGGAGGGAEAGAGTAAITRCSSIMLWKDNDNSDCVITVDDDETDVPGMRCPKNVAPPLIEIPCSPRSGSPCSSSSSTLRAIGADSRTDVITHRTKSIVKGEDTSQHSAAMSMSTATPSSSSTSTPTKVQHSGRFSPLREAQVSSTSLTLGTEVTQPHIDDAFINHSITTNAATPTQSTPPLQTQRSTSRVSAEGRSVAPVDTQLTSAQQRLMEQASETFACQKAPQRKWGRKKNDFLTSSAHSTSSGASASTFTENTEQGTSREEGNEELIALFTSMAENVDQRTGTDQFRARANRKTAAVLSGLQEKVTLENYDALLKKKVGKKSLTKIEEFLVSGRMRQAEFLENDPKRQAVKRLAKVWGVGSVTASKWYEKGMKSIDDVRAQVAAKTLTLSSNQAVGVEFYEEFMCKIPRQEVKDIFEKVKEAADEFSFSKIECVGSYRRKKLECGDVDILICSPENSSKKKNWEILRKLTDKLFAQGLMTHRLHNYRTHDKDEEHATSTFMGVCQLAEKPHRRIDIKIWPGHQYAYALMHFTGSGHFNRSIRLYAQRLGYSLSDHGLCSVQRDVKTREKVCQAKTVPAETEEEIFAHLGLTYMPPECRTAGLDEEIAHSGSSNEESDREAN